MIRVREIDDLDLPELAPYRTMRLQAEHYRDRRFVAEGDKVVRRLLESDLSVVSVLLPPDLLEDLRPALDRHPDSIEVFVAPRRILESLTGFSLYQGLLACACMPPPEALDVVLARAPRPRFLVAVDGVSNVENMGALVRNAAAFGAHGLLVGETCVHPYMRRAVRSSMGAIFRMPVVEVTRLPLALAELRRVGIRCVAAHPHDDRRVLPESMLTGDCCIVLGSEGEGLTPEVRDACDECVAVPMHSGVDSLNVGAAGAVFFYEVWRQRFRLGSP
ncbi:MAG: RNA methyltransferase [Verrucomicrobiales bacterium]|nr:RNA methyltransferase [Verrucomicrobiales bacterium]